MLPRIQAALAVPDDVHPLDPEAPLQIGHRRGDPGGVLADGAHGVELDSLEAHVPGRQDAGPGGGLLARKPPYLGGPESPAVHQQERTPGQARLVLGFQGHPVDFERQVPARLDDVAGEHEGDLVAGRVGLGAARRHRGRARAGVGREPHGQHGDVQREQLPA